MQLSDADLEDLFDHIKAWYAARAGTGPVAPSPPAAPLPSTPAPSRRAGGPPIWVGASRLTFDEPFDTLDWSRWDSVPIVNDPNGNGSSLPPNSELQWYINHRYAATKHIVPWKVGPDGLTITARAADPADRPLLGHDAAKFPELGGKFGLGSYPYTSGRLSTNRAFNQQYGYFEAEMKLPAGRGLWPAFWLLPVDMSWPPEIDVVEVLGHEPGKAYQTLHSAGVHPSPHVVAEVDTTAWRRYGVLWRKEAITFFVDGEMTREFPTPKDMHKPMYMILNLAVGGSWGGNPDEKTAFPAEMHVRRVSAWAIP